MMRAQWWPRSSARSMTTAKSTRRRICGQPPPRSNLTRLGSAATIAPITSRDPIAAAIISA